jgi:hypothetical protein
MELKGQDKRDVVSRVINAALHTLHNSYLPDTKLWPTAGIRIGNGMSEYKKECIFMGVNAFQPKIGALHMWPTTNSESRERSQKKHIRMILDYAIHDGVQFIDQAPNSPDHYLWFDYTLTNK